MTPSTMMSCFRSRECIASSVISIRRLLPPQLITKTVFVAGTTAPVVPLKRDYSTKTAENLKVELSTMPAEPLAGVNTQMSFTLSPGDGIEKYLGAWGHMLAASDDLIDLMAHTSSHL